MVLPSSLVLVLLLLLVEVPPADWSLLVTGLMMVSLKDLATDLVSALDRRKLRSLVWSGLMW